MDAPNSISIFSLLVFTAHCSLGQAFSWEYCGKSTKVLQARQGEIYSSSVHGPPAPINCTWIITASVGERVILSFSEMNIVCGLGHIVWLTVTTLTDKPISICGYRHKPMELYGGNITVKHHFVPPFSSSGFRMSYIKGSGPCQPGEFECYSDRCLPASWRCNGQVECLGEGDELGLDEDGCDFDQLPHPADDPSPAPTGTVAGSIVETGRGPYWDGGLLVQSQGGACGGYLQAFYGSFVAPVPTGGPVECVWTVDPQDPRPLRLDLRMVELGSGDSLVITDQPGGAGNIIKTITCTSNYKAVQVESRTGLLSLTYNMQAGSEGRGFNATYRIADYCLPWEGPCKGSEGGCFTQLQRCDGHWDCAETGLDEVGCGGCPAGQFPCGPLVVQRAGVMSRPVCFSIQDRCNYQLNCADGSDERDCTVCQPGTFHCDSDRCVFESWRCDGQVDCKDGTDELNCTMTLPRKVITAATVGSLVCGLLLVIAMGCTCKLYSLRTREYSLFAPISRQEAELIQQQAPPSYGQLIAQGVIPPVEDFPTENPNEPTSLSLRGLLQLIRQDNIASPRRRRRPRFIRRAIRRLRRWGLISRPASRPAQSTSSTSQQTEDTPPGQESGHSDAGDASLAREPASNFLTQKVDLSQQAEQEQRAEASPPPPSASPPSQQSVAAPEAPRSSPVATPPRSPSMASLFLSLFRPSSSPGAVSASPSFSSSSSDDEVLLIPLSDDTTSEDDVPMLT
ncbi:low-density lipoprotein receptor-related protein 10-like [Brachyhypopomus gauderio]|uniref:low-density lipoprotein receptor-related protein 10-like n=1 Tax=Brachyhypopomus gauderio TaxID=698409 RepID=UPI004042FE3D